MVKEITILGLCLLTFPQAAASVEASLLTGGKDSNSYSRSLSSSCHPKKKHRIIKQNKIRNVVQKI